MTLLCARLSRWALWEDTNGRASLTLHTPENTSAVSQPSVQNDLARSIKPGWRRRLDLFGRAAAETLTQMLTPVDNPHIVFCSRHGNINRTVKLLHQVATNEALSPADFSMSVHNAFVGIASINWSITQSHTAIAAGNDSLIAGLTETVCQMMATQSPVILCYVDLPLPDVYTDTVAEPQTAIAFAMRLEPDDDTTPEMPATGKALAFSSCGSDRAQTIAASSYDQVKNLTAFFASPSAPPLTLGSSTTAWTVSRHD
ncbi:beta-ketoacyl synthase chain length factor [Thalassospira lucentensis]|uniref:beta-ketoacyl synthase chain length factor n=1 Tax=Thalassospira lucentensis TaxID=168935 RepID=UPI003AA7D131